MYSSIPVINAGDGGHNHPTQTLIDLMTIRHRKGRLDNLTVGFCGDLKFGRTVHSLVNSLVRFNDNKFYFISPEELKVPDYLIVIMVTAKTTELDKVKGLDLGADDYITKPFGIMELISRVKALLRRTGSSDEEKLIGIGSLFIDDEKRVAYVDDKPVELTYKEYELLKYLALNRGIVLTRDNIMDRIWSTDYEGESRTLDVHIKTLRLCFYKS